MQRLVNEARQEAFLEALVQFIEAMWEQNFHFSDLFMALSIYSARESGSGAEETRQNWDRISILMQAAAQEARDLP